MTAVVYDFTKNAREVVRARLQEFAGRRVADVRAFLPKADGTLVPSPKGLTVDVDQLPELERAVSAIRAAAGGARQRGMPCTSCKAPPGRRSRPASRA